MPDTGQKRDLGPALLSNGQIMAFESALDIVDRARARLRQRPGYSVAISNPLLDLVRQDLDSAYHLMLAAMLPWRSPGG